MIRILIFSLMFFLGEGAFFLGFQDNILKFYANYGNWAYQFQGRADQLPTEAVRNIHTVNNRKEQARIFVGGSTAQIFKAMFYLLEPERRRKTYALDTSSQKFMATLRLIDNIRDPGAYVFIIIHPRKFINGDSRGLIGKAKYHYGNSGTFPLNSPAFDRVYDHLVKIHKIDVERHLGGPQNAFKMRLFLPANPLIIVHKEAVIGFIDKVAKSGAFKWLFLKKPPAAVHSQAGGISAEDRKAAPFRRWAKAVMPHREFRIKENFFLLDVITQTTRKRKLKLVLVDSPISDIHRKELLPHMTMYYEYLERFLKEHPDVEYYRFDVKEYPGDMHLFVDTLHVTVDGRTGVFKDYFMGALNYESQIR